MSDVGCQDYERFIGHAQLTRPLRFKNLAADEPSLDDGDGAPLVACCGVVAVGVLEQKVHDEGPSCKALSPTNFIVVVVGVSDLQLVSWLAMPFLRWLESLVLLDWAS